MNASAGPTMHLSLLFVKLNRSLSPKSEVAPHPDTAIGIGSPDGKASCEIHTQRTEVVLSRPRSAWSRVGFDVGKAVARSVSQAR